MQDPSQNDKKYRTVWTNKLFVLMNYGVFGRITIVRTIKLFVRTNKIFGLNKIIIMTESEIEVQWRGRAT